MSDKARLITPFNFTKTLFQAEADETQFSPLQLFEQRHAYSLSIFAREQEYKTLLYLPGVKDVDKLHRRVVRALTRNYWRIY